MDNLNQDLSTKKIAIKRTEAYPMFKKLFLENIGKQAVRKVKRRKTDAADSAFEFQAITIENSFDSSVLVSRIIENIQNETHILRFSINYSSLLTNEEEIIL